MSTTVEITCRGSVKLQAITHTICRIGSNPSLELCMPGIDDHTATLRIQNGKRLVYNRSAKAITLNGKQVNPEQTMEWNGNQVLELADGVRLRLLNTKGESKAVAAGASECVSPAANGAVVASQSQPSDQKQRRMSILGFFAVFATILFSTGADAPNHAMDQEFSQVVSALLQAEREPNSGRYQQIRIDLQNAILRTDPVLKGQSVQQVKQALRTNRANIPSAIDIQVERFIHTHF